MRVVHPQLLGAGVHLLDEQLRHARDVLGHRDGRVVSARDADRLEQILHRDLLALRQKHLAAAHRRGVGAHGHGVVIADAPLVERLHRQQERHHLRHARRLELLVLIFGVEHLSRRLLHQQRRLRLDRQLHRPAPRGEKHRCQNRRREERRPSFFHAPASLLLPTVCPGKRKHAAGRL